MRNKLNYALLYFLFIIFFSCNKSVNNKEEVYNGINPQILNIVDSISICSNDHPFISIWFTVCPDSDFVIKFFNGVIIPAPPLPPAPIKKILISESDAFRGYKKYGDIFLVFYETNSNEYFSKFVRKDSLDFNEEPFIRFKVYYDDAKIDSDCVFKEKIYLINENDSLISYDGKCMFDID